MDLFAYIDYRRFLGEYYRTKRAEKRGFSYRAFARRAGLRSSNHLKRIIDGDRNLSPRSVLQYVQALGLEGELADYFSALVDFNQAQTNRDREAAYARMLAFRGYRRAHHIDSTYAAYHARWFIPVIRELALRRDFEADPSWVAERVRPSIKRSEAAEALDVLFELRMLKRTEDGRVVQSVPVVTTGAQTRTLQVAHYHRTMLQLAADSIDFASADERHITALTFCVPQGAFVDIRERLQRFRNELVATLATYEDGDLVLQLGIQLFPVSVPHPPVKS